MLTNSILADKLNIPLSRIRRWVRELMPPDPRAGRRSGYTREFTNNDGFFTYVGGVMVADLEFSFELARETLVLLKPWLLSNGLVPDIPKSAKRRGIDERVSEYRLYFDFGLEEIREFRLVADCYVEGVIGSHSIEEKSHDRMGKFLFDYVEYEKKEIIYMLGRLKKFDTISTKMFPKSLQISLMLQLFIMKLFGLDSYKLWLDKWEKLCETPQPKWIGKR